MKRTCAILGSTGSIGVQTLQVVAEHRDRFEVEALAGGRNVELLARQVQEFKPRLVGVADKEAAQKLKALISPSVPIVWGVDGLIDVATYGNAHIVVVAVVGSIGLKPTLAALQDNKIVALANKETLVTAGHLVMDRLKAGQGTLIPVDSEHSAIYQALRGEDVRRVHRLILTASGGPFRNASPSAMAEATPTQALNHPTWSMGGKITIDSATLMNKGLEVIEARWLFDVDYDRIDVIIHPQSIVHSMVEYVDGAVLAQLGTADMRTPIQYALSYPDRIPTPWQRLSLFDQKLTFEAPDTKKFPALALAYEAGRMAGSAPAVLNAANEIAVDAFLKKQIGFLSIARCVEEVLKEHTVWEADSLEAVLEADAWARRRAAAWVEAHAR